MILIIDRSVQQKGYYIIEFGVAQDVLIGRWEIPYHNQETMSELDKIVTNSPNKVFCVTHLKHPLLVEEYNKDEDSLKKQIWNGIIEVSLKKKLREYFTLRLIHRKYPITLYEFGKRLFKP